VRPSLHQLAHHLPGALVTCFFVMHMALITFMKTMNAKIMPDLLDMARFFACVKSMKKQTSDIVPNQESGKAIDAVSSVELADENDARNLFEDVRKRLQNVKEWKRYAGNLSAEFQLVDTNGMEVQREPAKGDYLKIDIPGPGSKSGDGFDWVRIEEIVSTSTPDSESFGFRVRPTENPHDIERETAHFYSNESTSSFIVARTGNKVTASVHDRNTKPNTEAGRPGDKIRDVVVGTAGALTFSKLQWKNLTDGLLNL